MYVEVYRNQGLLARLTGNVGWRWRLKTADGVTLIDARETFEDRTTCLGLVALLMAGLTARVVDSESKRMLRFVAGEWHDGGEFVGSGFSVEWPTR
ncbi:TPA: hypothetical protein QDZ34_000882 [Stenotrophomonas maltophilia]|nr:hypothetical protein [Stenotrophomonas maltophilia]HDS1024614.1 hypothetical protein [Stenotrophomonas maltophilia]HDS1028998.1 hypothetical protein [Stenotrophomonas maltophilia]HDS1033566.1 hypothetical protein [Stenotrophomonas maltophilia]